MTRPTANGRTILNAQIFVPRRGVWQALVSVEAEDIADLVERVDLVFGATTWSGYARRSGLHHGRVQLLVVGGAGGLQRELEPRYYVDSEARVPLEDLMRECGEQLSGDVLPDVTSFMLARWTRGRGRGGALLSDLARVLGVEWRTLADGTVWLGAETWPDVELAADTVGEAPAHDQVDLAVDEPSLTAGVTLHGRHVSYVHHSIMPAAIRSAVWFEPEPEATGGPAGAAEAPQAPEGPGMGF